MPECRHANRNFSGQGRFCGTRALQINILPGKKVLQGNIFEFFAPIYSEKYVLNGKFNYQFSKNGRGSLTGFELTFQ